MGEGSESRRSEFAGEAWMPWFYFDLMIDGHPGDQGAMILEDVAVAKDRADALAREIFIAKPELQGSGCSVRVVDDEAGERYRTSIDPISTWSIQTVQK
jgi:hypothetical protein